MSSTPAINAAYLTYSRVHSSVLHLCEFRLSTATWEALRDETISSYGDHGRGDAKPSKDDRLFGQPVRIDDDLPLNVVEAWQKIS